MENSSPCLCSMVRPATPPRGRHLQGPGQTCPGSLLPNLSIPEPDLDAMETPTPPEDTPSTPILSGLPKPFRERRGRIAEQVCQLTQEPKSICIESGGCAGAVGGGPARGSGNGSPGGNSLERRHPRRTPRRTGKDVRRRHESTVEGLPSKGRDGIWTILVRTSPRRLAPKDGAWDRITSIRFCRTG